MVRRSRIDRPLQWGIIALPFSSAVAVGLALIAALFLQPDKAGFITAIIVGIAAIPLAPIAKDVAKGLRVAGEAIRTKK